MFAPTTIRRFYPASIFVLVFLLLFCRFALAQTMTSTNFRVQTDSLNMGGNSSNSTTYSAQDTLGEWSTGENMAGVTYQSCSGYQCFQSAPYVSFSVKTGPASPGTTGDPLSFGMLSASSVATSSKSIFITLTSNAERGTVVFVHDLNGGLKRVSHASDAIPSASATLMPGVQGFGLCVFAVGQGSDSPSALLGVFPFSGSCDKASLHIVGGISAVDQSVLQSSGPVSGGTAELLVKAAISTSTTAGDDYVDAMTFVATPTY